MSVSRAELENAVRVALTGQKRVIVLAGWQVERDIGERVRRAKVRNKSAKWRRDNPDRARGHGQSWRALNPTRKKAHDAAWRTRDPAAYAAMRKRANRRYYLKRKARLAANQRRAERKEKRNAIGRHAVAAQPRRLLGSEDTRAHSAR